MLESREIIKRAFPELFARLGVRPVLDYSARLLNMVNISHIPDVQIGDEVVLIGRQKNNVIAVSSFIDATQLLNNEMLSRLPAAILKVVVA